MITSPVNVLLSDQEQMIIRKRREHRTFQQHVFTDICFGDKNDEYCNQAHYRMQQQQQQHYQRSIQILLIIIVRFEDKYD